MRKNKILTYIATFVIIICTFTLVQGYFPFFLRSWIFLGALAVLITLFYTKFNEKVSSDDLFYCFYLIFEETKILFLLTEITFILFLLPLLILRNNDLKS